MKVFPTLATLVVLTFAVAFAPAAKADNCSQIADQVAASRSAQVLSVRPATRDGGTVCIIKLRIPGKEGRPPRVETIRLNG